MLSLDEMKQQVVNPIRVSPNGIQSHSGDCGSGEYIYESDCYNGVVISCCGVEVEAKMTIVKGKQELEYLKCTKADGRIVTSDKCDLTLAGSGVATTIWEACAKKKPTELCEWNDGVPHQGKCEIEGGGNDPYGALFCDETKFP